ncbi:collagen alpha-1(I) chain-like [Corapipo altera]|uniref:collagen alpha-1(I) chain-like n=1 Tax=Corapipo altera TaxID=415028 RepID=UPI000FD67ABF|nr:collagen alpha-1(I) chain-like [Corapipo altera]
MVNKKEKEGIFSFGLLAFKGFGGDFVISYENSVVSRSSTAPSFTTKGRRTGRGGRAPPRSAGRSRGPDGCARTGAKAGARRAGEGGRAGPAARARRRLRVPAGAPGASPRGGAGTSRIPITAGRARAGRRERARPSARAGGGSAGAAPRRGKVGREEPAGLALPPPQPLRGPPPERACLRAPGPGRYPAPPPSRALPGKQLLWGRAGRCESRTRPGRCHGSAAGREGGSGHEKQPRLDLAAGPGSSIHMLVELAPWKTGELPGFTEELLNREQLLGLLRRSMKSPTTTSHISL